MTRKSYALVIIEIIGAMMLSGCTGSDAGIFWDKTETQAKTKKDEASDSKENALKGRSLAQRMAGKYSYHYSDENGNDEFYIMEVIPFGDNLYAFCGQAMPDDQKSLDAYTFWASEFIPYDKDEVTSEEKNSVTVNELRFSVMSNAGRFWDQGCKGTISLTDEGLVFEGFEGDDFLAPANDSSRLFLKDDRVRETFIYQTHDPKGGDKDLQGLWILDNKGADLYLEFEGSDLYIYKKDPDSEVFFVSGGCKYNDGSFDLTASRLGYGGQPFEMSCEYKVTDDKLTLKVIGTDGSEVIPGKTGYSKIKDGSAHITTMDEVKIDLRSSQDYYGVFVSAAKAPDRLEPARKKFDEAGLGMGYVVYTPDFEELNPEPYYVLCAGIYTEESNAQEVLSDVQEAGFKDAYVKHAGAYLGDKYWYTMSDAEKIEVSNDGVMLRNVKLSIPYPSDVDPITADLLVPKDAVFDETAETEYFGNYEKGDTPYEWIVRNYELMHEDTDRYLMHGPALSGVFEVGIKDNRITTYYGSYWWD